jgi:hypothetical protein
MIKILMLVVLMVVVPFKLQVSHIECLNTSQAEVHFIANQSGLDLSNSQVDYVMNGVSYVAQFTKHTGDAYHFSTVITTTGLVTYTITEAYIQYSSDIRVDAHNLPYTKTLNCNPTALTLTSFTAETMHLDDVLDYFLVALGSAFVIIIAYRLLRKNK